MKEHLAARFLSYVEIRTKIASLLPFLLGLAYVWHANGRLDGWNTAVFFLSMLCFDMTTTALNNYVDTKTNGVALPFARPVAKRILLTLLALAILLGLALAVRTGLVVLAAGAFCFFIGIAYTFGPAPISRMPLGEAFSGFVMGFFIPFLTIYVNAPKDQLVWYALNGGVLELALRLPDLLRLLLLTVAPIACIANIMLANNICDVEHDCTVKRFTLPYYLGRPRALQLFALLYAAAFAAIAALPLLGILPAYAALVLLAAIPVWRNVRKFSARPVKRETFALSVQNMVLMLLPLIILTAI